jgi:DNA-directed RNA polymerase subunit RPC12/RpoP
MRNLVEPLPSTHCERCGGELLFKKIETDDPALDLEVQIFVCARCGREHSRRLIHEPYTAHTACGAGRKGSA